ncbi:MAG: sugar phosphate nucleotidyltransferase [Candidatus Thermoplasmatota archaeon]|nr:sugar phosphate nucleotidyltransferase [Candidatus Thermoplasmatota archaeon]
MKALILAAGQGTRMGPLTENRPKPMLPVAGKCFLEHTLVALRDSGVREVYILTGYHGATIKDHFGNGTSLSLDIEYLVQPKRLGTAHAVSMAKDVMNEPFLCINADVIVSEGLVKGLMGSYEDGGFDAMTLVKVDDCSRFGLVESKGGFVERIIEKPGNKMEGLINGGIYLFNEHIFDAIERTPLSSRGEYELTRSIEILMCSNKVRAFIPEVEWVDIGSPWDLLDANGIYMAMMEPSVSGIVEENVHIRGRLHLGKDALVRSGTYIEGDVFIDEGAIIGPNSYIRGSTYIGKRCKVGAGSEVKNSIIMEGTSVPHHNYVGDSVIGSGCNLGSGTKIANLRFDHASVKVILNDSRIDTGRKKLGAIIGDGVNTGINSSLGPGTVICGGASIGPGKYVKGTIGRNALVL